MYYIIYIYYKYTGHYTCPYMNKYHKYKFIVYYKTTVHICSCYGGSSKFLYFVKMMF